MTAEYTLFSSLHETFTKEDHILCCKTHPYKFKRIEIISRLLSNHNRSKLEISNRNIAEKKKKIPSERLNTTCSKKKKKNVE